MRQIEPKMVQFLDDRLKDNGLAQHAIETKDARTLMVEAAKVCVGIREKTNNNDGPMVELIQETIGRANHEAWCMGFVQTMIAYAEFKTGVKSPVFDGDDGGEHCQTVWRKTPKDMRVKISPLPGAIVIWRHGSSENGHTGILLGSDERIFSAVEGNTTKGEVNGRIVREGGGVYFTTRSRYGDGDMNIVGYLIPFRKEA